MSTFDLQSPWPAAGDQPNAIKELVEGIENNDKYQTLLGITGSGKTRTVADVIDQVEKPTLVMSHNKTLAAQLYREFSDFFPDNKVEFFISYYDYYQPEAYISGQDKFIEKDLSINEEIQKLRLRATSSLLSGRRDVIIVSSVSCIYGIGSPSEYEKLIISLETGMEIPRNTLLYDLVDLHYTRKDNDFGRGTFRVRGDVVDLYPAYAEDALRIQFWGDEIEKLEIFDVDSGKVLDTVDVIKRLAPKLNTNTILADFTSNKTAPIEAMQAAHDGPILGLHPMHGPDVQNLSKQLMVVCPVQQPEACRWVVDQAKLWGMRIVEADPEKHDHVMHMVQGLRHFVALLHGSFMQTYDLKPQDILEYSSPIYRAELMMTGRIFAQSAELYADIVFANKERRELLLTFIEHNQKLAEMVKDDDKEGFIKEFEAVTDFFGSFATQALKESSYLINRLADRFA